MPGAHPTLVDKRKLKRVALHHLSWTQVLTEAVVQRVHRGVADPDQAWILGELIRYLEHPRSGALEFEDMGTSWVSVRRGVSSGTLRANDKEAVAVAGRWDSFIRYLSLRLGRQLGTEVQPALNKKELADPAIRAAVVLSSLTGQGRLEGGIKIPNTIATLQLAVDLRANQVIVWLDVDAPKEGRPQTRINWLTRQLEDAPDNLRVDAFTLNSRGAGTSGLLVNIRATPQVLIEDPKREIRSFRLTLTSTMATKRGQKSGSFVAAVTEAVDQFYGQVVQNLKQWSALPPKLRDPDADVAVDEAVSVALASTALSSQDGPDSAPVDAARPLDAEAAAQELQSL